MPAPKYPHRIPASARLDPCRRRDDAVPDATETVPKLIRLWDESNSTCRGARGGAVRVAAACLSRSVYGVALNERDWVSARRISPAPPGRGANAATIRCGFLRFICRTISRLRQAILAEPASRAIVVWKKRAVSAGPGGKENRADFSGFSPWPTKWQTSSCPARPVSLFPIRA